jgi:hypothetical protein
VILPSRHLPAERALISVGGEVLAILRNGPLSVSDAWEDLRKSERRHPLSFDWFALALALLFSMGLLELHDERLHLRRPE